MYGVVQRARLVSRGPRYLVTLTGRCAACEGQAKKAWFLFKIVFLNLVYLLAPTGSSEFRFVAFDGVAVAFRTKLSLDFCFVGRVTSATSTEYMPCAFIDLQSRVMVPPREQSSFLRALATYPACVLVFPKPT